MSTLALALVTLARKDPGAVYEALESAIKAGIAERTYDDDQESDIVGKDIGHYGPLMRLGVLHPLSIKVFHMDFYQAPVVLGQYEGGSTMIAVPSEGFGISRMALGYTAAHRLETISG